MKRKTIHGLMAASLSLALILMLAELGLRVLIFSDLELATFLHSPARYADYYSDDDYWKLYSRWKPEFPPPKEPHPLLGWVWKVEGDLLHVDAHKLGERRPVLLYGDSFANCVAPARCFEEILEDDKAFSREHLLLNYGIGGYGVDQILLLMRETLDLYQDPLVVFSLMTHDLDRSVLSVRIGQKPYFELVDGRLELRGVPVEPSAEAYFANHPPRIRSYLWAMLVHSRALPGPVGTFLRGDVATLARKREINRAILASAALELQHRELDFVFLVFHPEVELRAASWRTIWLTETLDALEVPHRSSMDLIHARRPDTPLSEFIEESNGHPTTLYNTVIANAIAEWVLAAQVRGECP